MRPDHFGPDEERRGGPLRLVLASICAAMLLAMMGITLVDVIGRYLLNSPLVGATELTELMLVGVVFLGLPAVTLDRGHVSVSLLSDRLPARFQPLREFILSLVIAALLSAIGWRIFQQGNQIAGYGGTTETLDVPLAPVAWFCAACIGVSALMTLWLGMSGLRGARVSRNRVSEE
ncbi:TRAP transporter small permease [Pseudohoeflea suaedae]|uniref:TRAP transporter small permease protein n=2 Tax=Pseudohoeflea suaedae TaxID=877384 RepID=A0A4R5PR68_9HYPH|nr:TRAP transporter small permease [Pseudohoeflea suaedae]